MLVHMGKEIPLFLFVLVVSTLIPLWVYAKWQNVGYKENKMFTIFYGF